MVESTDVVTEIWIRVPVQSFFGCVTFNLSKSQFGHLQNGESCGHPVGLVMTEGDDAREALGMVLGYCYGN